jgi:ketosteroid isomerase-like protein
VAAWVETVRRLEAAFREYDVDAILECVTPDAEILPLRARLEGKAYVGANGIRAMVADLAEDWESIDQRMEDYREVGDEVVTLGRMHAKSNATGIDLDVPLAWVLRFEGDLLAYGKAYSDPAEALRAAGLEE